MLNTDLHIADLKTHMSRADFVRNSMRAIQESMLPVDGSSSSDLVRDDSSSFTTGFGSNPSVAPSSISVRPKPPPHPPNTPRSASAPVVAADSRSNIETNGRASSAVSSFNYSRAWEMEAENALKVGERWSHYADLQDIYGQVRADRILLPINGAVSDYRQSLMSIGSSSHNSGRGMTIRSPSDRVNALKRGSIRGQGLGNNPYQSQISSDGRFSLASGFSTTGTEVSSSLYLRT